MNEIAHFAHDEIHVTMDEICCADEIKSVPYPDKVRLHHEVISSIEDGFIPSKKGRI